MGEHRPARTAIAERDLPKPEVLLTMNLTAVTRDACTLHAAAFPACCAPRRRLRRGALLRPLLRDLAVDSLLPADGGRCCY